VRQAFVDDDRLRALGRLAIVEVPTAHEGRPRGFEVARCDRRAQCGDGRLSRLRHITFGDDDAALVEAPERHNSCPSCGNDAWQPSDRIERAIHEGPGVFVG